MVVMVVCKPKTRDLGLMLGKKIQADFETRGDGALCK